MVTKEVFKEIFKQLQGLIRTKETPSRTIKEISRRTNQGVQVEDSSAKLEGEEAEEMLGTFNDSPLLNPTQL
jgi:hypothetical protein